MESLSGKKKKYGLDKIAFKFGRNWALPQPWHVLHQKQDPEGQTKSGCQDFSETETKTLRPELFMYRGQPNRADRNLLQYMYSADRKFLQLKHLNTVWVYYGGQLAAKDTFPI